MKRTFIPGLLTSLLSMLAASAAPQGSGWTVVPSTHVSGQNELAEAIVAPAAGDVWAIGYHWGVVGGATEFRTLAKHFDGTTMVTVPTPDRETAPAKDFLWGAAASGSNDVWAVGTSAGSPHQTLAEHWDGTSWSIVTTPNPGRFGNDLQAVTAISPTDAWAVGARQDNFYQTPLAIHWNGRVWKTVPAPTPPGGTGHSYLTGVSAVRHNSVWATGWVGSGGSTPEQGYVLHWDGTAWSIVLAIPATDAPESETYAISAANDYNVWVVGTYLAGTARISTPLTLHYDGHSWTMHPATPALGLAGVTATRHGTWTVGNGPGPQPPFANPSALRWVNNAWFGKPLPHSFDYGRLNAVTTDPNGIIWAAGFNIGNPDDVVEVVHR